MFFLGGSAIFVGCFLTASSHAYRSIYLLLIVPGLLRMGRGYWPITVAGFLATLLPWAWLLPISRSGVRFGLSDWLGWFSIQALWWWLVTVLSALLIVGVSRSQAGTMLLARLGIKRFGAMV